MGTDIHCAVERLGPHVTLGGEARWRFGGVVSLPRCYPMFGVMAGIRGDLPCIARRRGIPADLDDYTAEAEILGEHSKSWLLLSELRAYTWDDLHSCCSVVPLRRVDELNRARRSSAEYESYEEWTARAAGSERVPPVAYCGVVSGGVHVLDLRGPDDAEMSQLTADLASEDELDRDRARRLIPVLTAQRSRDRDEADRLLADHSLMPAPEVLFGQVRPCTAWARVSWWESARELCPALVRWVDDHAADDGDRVRLVFGFDS